jgi:hypothetical protein
MIFSKVSDPTVMEPNIQLARRKLITLATESTRTKAHTTGGDPTSPLVYIAWFVVGAALGFLIPFIFTSLLSLHHDFYYLIYFAITLAFLGIYIGATHVDLAGFFRSNWHWSLALGALAAVALVFNVVSRG